MVHNVAEGDRFLDSNIAVIYFHSNEQIADMSTKGSFTRDELMILFREVSGSSHHRSPVSFCLKIGSASSADGGKKPPYADEASRLTSASSKSSR